MPYYYYEDLDRGLYACMAVGFTCINLEKNKDFLESRVFKNNYYEKVVLNEAKHFIVNITQLNSFERYFTTILSASNDKTFLNISLSEIIKMFKWDDGVPGFIERGGEIPGKFLENYVNFIFLEKFLK